MSAALSVLLEFDYVRGSSAADTAEAKTFSAWMPWDDATQDVGIFVASLRDALAAVDVRITSDLLADLRGRVVEAIVAASLPRGADESEALGILALEANARHWPERSPANPLFDIERIAQSLALQGRYCAACGDVVREGTSECALCHSAV